MAEMPLMEVLLVLHMVLAEAVVASMVVVAIHMEVVLIVPVAELVVRGT